MVVGDSPKVTGARVLPEWEATRMVTEHACLLAGGNLDPAQAQLGFRQHNHSWAAWPRVTELANSPALPRFAVFDMDSTLLVRETFDDIARSLGLSEQFSTITEQAMRGEIDFVAALHDRLALLEDFDTTDFALPVTFSPGATTLIPTLLAHGVEVIIATGGFRAVAVPVARLLGIMRVVGNVWQAKAGKMTGKLLGEMVTGETKREVFLAALKDNAKGFGLAVGDGSNDVEMLEAARETGGLGVCYYGSVELPARPFVESHANAWLNGGDMRDILQMLGIARSRWKTIDLQATSIQLDG